MAAFLTDAWFDGVQKAVKEAGDLQLPPALATLVLNIQVTGTPEGDKQFHLKGGAPNKGFDSSAPTKVILPFDLAKKLFIDNDQSVGMQGFMSGKIKIEGDMSKMMAMNSVKPSAKQEELRKKIVALTD